MKLSRRSLIKSLGAGTAAAAVGSLAAPAVIAQSPREIVYWGHNFPTRVSIVNDIMVPGFVAETGIDVRHEDFETNQNELRILTGWAGGGAEGPDLVSVGDSNLPNYVYRNLIAPVDPEAFGYSTQEELVDAFEPGALDGFIVDGVLYGMPMDLASISMFYRRDFFEEAGLDPDRPPQTWDEVTEMGKELIRTDSGGTVTRAGWGWMARSNSSHFYYWGTLLPQYGVDYVNADATANGFNNEAGLAAFQYLHGTFHGEDRVSALGLAPTISPVDDFGSGRVAMLNAGMWLAPGVEGAFPDVTYADGVYGVARLPQLAGGTPATRLNPWVYMVSANSSVQREAWEFVAYMIQRQESRDIWFREAQFVLPWRGFREDEAIQENPYAQIFFDDLEIGVPQPRTHRFTELGAIVAQAYDRISANGEAPETVVPDLADEIDFLLID